MKDVIIIENQKNIIKLYSPIIIISLLIGVILFRQDSIKWIWNIIKPAVVAFAFAYLLDSIVTFFIRKLKIKRNFSILFTYLMFLGLVVLLVSFLIPLIVENFNSVITLLSNEEIDFTKIFTDIKTDNKLVSDVVDFIVNSSGNFQSSLNDIIRYIVDYVVKFATGLGMGLFSTITSIFISIYMLVEKEDLIARIKRLTFAYFSIKKAEKMRYVVNLANNTFKRYFNGRILDALLVGIIATIPFLIFKIPYAPLMGTIIGVFNLIPYFGPFFGSIPVIVVSFFVDPAKALTALIIIMVVQQIDGNFLDPKIVGNNVGVSPFWVIAAVTVGGAAAGPVGMIIGVPITVLIKNLVEESVDLKLKEKNLGDLELNKIKNPKKMKKFRFSLRRNR